MGDFDLAFFTEVLMGSLLSGVMYSLVAIGLVLIYKTSGVLNFAQGAQLLSAALTFVNLLGRGMPFPLALSITFILMVLLGFGIERVVLRPLVNRLPIMLSMATLGLSYVIEGVTQLVWDTQVHALNLGISNMPLQIDGILISSFNLLAAAIATVIVTALSVFFRYTRISPVFRAVTDDTCAAVAVSLRLPWTQATTWAAASVIALVVGLLWGACLGVQFSLSLMMLRALPVLALGGFDSILGVIVGGLIIGVLGKLAEIYLGPFVSGDIESWIAYVAALTSLLIRPGGLFGLHPVERA